MTQGLATALTFDMHSTVMTIVNTIASTQQKTRLLREVIENGNVVAGYPGSLRGFFLCG